MDNFAFHFCCVFFVKISSTPYLERNPSQKKTPLLSSFNIRFSGTKIDLKSMSMTSLTRKRKTTMKSCQFQWLPSTWCLLKVWISKAILNFNVFKSCKGGLILESIFTLVSSSSFKSEKSMLGTVISHFFFENWQKVKIPIWG